MYVRIAGEETVQQNATTSGNFSITVPTDAEAILVLWSGYTGPSSTPVAAFTELNFDNGGTLDVPEEERSNFADTGGNQGCNLSANLITNTSADWPGTGSQTLYWTLTGWQYGATIKVIYLRDLDTSTPVSATDFQLAVTTAWNASLGTVDAGDLAVLLGRGFQTTSDMNPDGDQNVIEELGAYNSIAFGAAYAYGMNDIGLGDGGDYNNGVALNFNAAATVPGHPYITGQGPLMDSNTASTSDTLSAPSGAAQGDVLLAVVAIGGTSSTDSISLSSDTTNGAWTEVDDQSSGDTLNVRSAIYVLDCSSGAPDASWTASWDSSVKSQGCVWRISGADASNVLSAFNNVGEPHPFVCPTLTTTSASNLIFRICAQDGRGAEEWLDNQSQFNILFYANCDSDGVATIASFNVQDTAGAVGTAEFESVASIGDQHVAWTIAIPPAAQGITPLVYHYRHNIHA